jgi:hypothetical protein
MKTSGEDDINKEVVEPNKDDSLYMDPKLKHDHHFKIR